MKYYEMKYNKIMKDLWHVTVHMYVLSVDIYPLYILSVNIQERVDNNTA